MRSTDRAASGGEVLQVLLILRQKDSQPEMSRDLAGGDMACAVLDYGDLDGETLGARRPDVLLAELDALPPGPEISRLISEAKKKRTPVIALVPAEALDGVEGGIELGDDFVIGPYRTEELALRINRLLERAGKRGGDERIESDGLTIDLVNCEVTVAGRVVELTYKEYELLKLLAGNPGRVYTRDALLDKVWGYDYFGGDRTVDVHIRRLRSKIEESGNVFIETVRNIGYRFRKETK